MSQDENRDGLGIERQEAAIQRFLDERGWTVAPGWWLTETASAFSASKPRPQFERLLRGIESGDVSAVVVYAQDRLTRRMRDFLRVAEAVEETACEIHVVSGGSDWATAYGRGIAGVLASVASMETQVMSERHRHQTRQARRAGRVTNGGTRGFGYESDRMTPVPEEHALLRDAYDRLVRGDSLMGIAKDWNRRGVPTATQRPPLGAGPDWQPSTSRWTVKVLRNTLQRPMLCGRVMEWQMVPGSDGRKLRQQVLVRDDDGRPVRGLWQPVFTEEEFDRLQVILAARKTMNEGWTSDRRHLLSGLLRCGRCSGTMVAHKQPSGKICYSCRDFKHLTRDETLLDEHVTDLVAHALESRSFEVDGWAHPDGAAVAHEIAALEERKHQAIQSLTGGALGPETFGQMVAEFDRQIVALRDQQVQTVAEPFETVKLEGIDLPSLSLDLRHTVIAAFIARIIVWPTKRRGKGFDPDCVEVLWVPQEWVRVHRAHVEEDGQVTLTVRRARPLP